MSLVRKLVPILVVASLFAVPLLVQAAGPITITLNPLNNSGESGTAVLTDLGGGQTKVEVTVTGQPAGVPQPMHIHTGTCANLGGVAYPLTNLVDGKSETTVNVSLDQLQAGQFAINGHKSATELSVYVFCGDIPLATTLPTSGGSSTALPLAALALGVLAFGTGLILRRFAR